MTTISRSCMSLCVALVLALLALASPAAAQTEEQVVAPAAGTPDHVVSLALQAALTEDADAAFKAYLELIHPDRKSTPNAISQLKKYSWTRFRKQAPDYVLAESKGGYVVTRRDPPNVKDDTVHVRLFLKSVNNPKRTYPTPVRLQRHEGAWYITANSL